MKEKATRIQFTEFKAGKNDLVVVENNTDDQVILTLENRDSYIQGVYERDEAIQIGKAILKMAGCEIGTLVYPKGKESE